MTADEFYSFENLWRHYRACRRNKRNTFNALAFEIDAEAKLLALREELLDHSYRPGQSICFVTRGPKPREVFAADFRDRVVHHLLVSRQEPLFERRFIHDSYACRKGKGTLAASDALMWMLRRQTANGRRPGYALRLDIASFFSSIDKAILYEIVAGAIRDPEVQWLTRVILFHDPTTDYRFRALDPDTPPPTSPDYPVPERKSLFGKGGRRGLPIGNLTSQFWANVYLDVLDQFVKRELRCRYYVRYVDDFVLLSSSEAELARWRDEIAAFLREQLALKLRPGMEECVPLRRAVDFVGWRTWWNRRVVRRQTLGNLVRTLDRFERRHTCPAFGGVARRLEVPTTGPIRPPRRSVVARGGRAIEGIDDLRTTLASYGGHLRHGASCTPWRRIWDARPWLGAVFHASERWRATPRWSGEGGAVGGETYGTRYRRVTRHAGTRCLVFWPVGRYVEFHGPQRLLAEHVLGLRCVRLARGDYALTAGFPWRLAERFARTALARGYDVMLVARRCGASGEPARPRSVLLSPAVSFRR